MTGLRAYAFESLARFLGEHFHEDTSGLQFISAIGALLKEEGPESLHKVHDDLVALLARDEDEAALVSFVSYAGVASSSSVFGQIDDWLKALEAALSRCRGITSS